MASTVAPVATKPVYQLDETLRTHLTRVQSVACYLDIGDAQQDLFKAVSGLHEDRAKLFVVETEETIFYAQGGGQPYDVGYMDVGSARFEVQAVRYGNDGRIMHCGTFNDAHFASGDMVEQHVDGKRRDMNSRCHTAGHIIGLSVRRLIEQDNTMKGVTELKASHYPDASFVEFQGLIDGNFKEAIQEQATGYVKQALPINLYWRQPEELKESGVITPEGMPIVAGHDGRVRVVNIESAGAYPCGGTHVQDTSLVGIVTVKGIKRQKGISKVSYTIS